MSDTIEKIRIYGDPVLRKVSGEVTEFNGELAELEEKLIDAMFAHSNGIGLSAPQIGVSKQMLVIDTSFGEEYDKIFTMVNPVIVSTEGEITIEEGCLSIPGIYEPVTRPSKIFVRYRDMDGNEREIENDDYLARVIQHEADHLNGVLFVDRIGTVRRTLLSKKLKTLTKEGDIV